jgi:hypothetical protein
MSMATKREVIQDEQDAERRYAKGEQPEDRDELGPDLDQDSKRYRYLRDQVRNSDGSINEQLYVRCDTSRDGRWSLDGEALDSALDLLLINRAEAEKAAARAAKEEKAKAKGR